MLDKVSMETKQETLLSSKCNFSKSQSSNLKVRVLFVNSGCFVYVLSATERLYLKNSMKLYMTPKLIMQALLDSSPQKNVIPAFLIETKQQFTMTYFQSNLESWVSIAKLLT